MNRRRYSLGVTPTWRLNERWKVSTLLVLAGRDDFQYPPRHQQELASAIQGARLVLIDEAGHNAPHERPEEVMAAVREFLS